MHRDARLTPTGRRIMVEPIAAGPPQAHVAEQTSVSRATVSKWRRRRPAEGDAGLEDRSSKPHRSPTRTPKRVEQRVCRLRRSKRRGPPTVAMHTGGPASTVHEILVRHDLDRLARIDRLTGRVIRRCERAHPGEPIHPAVGKVAGIPPGGGPRVRGRGRVENGRVGCTHLHCAVDDRSRVACVEAHDDERAETPVGFRSRARGWFRARAMTVDDAMADTGSNFGAGLFAAVSARTGNPGTAAPARTGPDPTARSSGSTGPWPTGSSTRSRCDQRTNDDIASTAGSTTTTITATPHRRRRPTRITRPQPLWLLHLGHLTLTPWPDTRRRSLMAPSDARYG